MALNQDKYDIEVQNDDAIKFNRLLFDFMQQTFNLLDGLYLHENFLLVDTIKEYQSREHIAAEIEKLNSETNSRNTRKEGISKPYPKSLFCE